MKIQLFMQVFMYLLENKLLGKKEELKKVSFSSDEANTDRPLKEFVKSLIERELKYIPSEYGKFDLIVNDAEKSRISFGIFSKVFIKKVYLPEEITDGIKSLLISQKGSSIYRNPDLLLEISLDEKTVYQSIELKSTKNDSIPGSSAQQVTPNEWVVFVKHNDKEINITTGQYIHAINSVMQFPDRSPRPQVSFKELQNWNKSNRIAKERSLSYLVDSEEKEKYQLLEDWQGVLSSRWIDMLFDSKTIKQNEPWFNNNMRRFVVEFLEVYEPLNDKDKLSFKNNLKSLIEEYNKKNS